MAVLTNPSDLTAPAILTEGLYKLVTVDWWGCPVFRVQPRINEHAMEKRNLWKIIAYLLAPIAKGLQSVTNDPSQLYIAPPLGESDSEVYFQAFYRYYIACLTLQWIKPINPRLLPHKKE